MLLHTLLIKIVAKLQFVIMCNRKKLLNIMSKYTNIQYNMHLIEKTAYFTFLVSLLYLLSVRN